MALERHDLAGFAALAPEWEALAAKSGSPFLTAAWLGNWWRASAAEDGYCLALRSAEGRLLAGGCFREGGARLRSAISPHTNDWGLVAAGAEERRRFWAAAAALGRRGVVLERMPGAEQAEPALAGLREGGYRVLAEAVEAGPWMELPGSLDELLAGRSRNLRSQVGRRTRKLEGEGELTMRVLRGGGTLARDLDAFFELEASGWKGKEGTGTAIAADPSLLALYRGFAEEAAAAGWFRLYLLELDGRLIAADYGCAFDGCGYLIKTAFDEGLGQFAPGLVLRAKVIESSIEEGLDRYDFLGGPDGYKMRWTDELRERVTVRAWRGPGSVLPHAWRSSLRPALKRARDAARARAGRRDGGS